MSKRTIVRRPEKKPESKHLSMEKPEAQKADAEQEFVQQMYIISERWQSDLVFFYDELNFLRKLIDKYFMWLIDDENIESTQKLASTLSKLEKRRFSILQKLDQHRRRLVNLTESPFSHNAQESKDEHSEIEVLLAGFAKEFRQTKKEVFHLTEQVIDSEKAKRLLTNGN